MKKILMHFSENILSRSQMKSIKGGYDEEPPVGCWPCKDDARFLCSIQIGGDCKCTRDGLGDKCQRVDI